MMPSIESDSIIAGEHEMTPVDSYELEAAGGIDDTVHGNHQQVLFEMNRHQRFSTQRPYQHNDENLGYNSDDSDDEVDSCKTSSIEVKVEIDGNVESQNTSPPATSSSNAASASSSANEESEGESAGASHRTASTKAVSVSSEACNSDGSDLIVPQYNDVVKLAPIHNDSQKRTRAPLLKDCSKDSGMFSVSVNSDNHPSHQHDDSHHKQAANALMIDEEAEEYHKRHPPKRDIPLKPCFCYQIDDIQIIMIVKMVRYVIYSHYIIMNSMQCIGSCNVLVHA